MQRGSQREEEALRSLLNTRSTCALAPDAHVRVGQWASSLKTAVSEEARPQTHPFGARSDGRTVSGDSTETQVDAAGRSASDRLARLRRN